MAFKINFILFNKIGPGSDNIVYGYHIKPHRHHSQ
jgi:hypothetical protein